MSKTRQHRPFPLAARDWVLRVFVGPPRRLTVSSDVREGMFLGVVEAACSTVSLVLLSGAFLTGFALLLGLSDFHLSILGALPMAAGLPGLLGSYIADRLRSRKRVVLAAAITGRCLWAGMIFVPYLPLSELGRIWLFIGLFGGASLIQGIASTPWLAWISDLVPDVVRGRYWGRRNALLSIMNIGALLAAGWILDTARRHDMELFGFELLIAIAVAFGLSGLLATWRQHEPPVARAAESKAIGKALEPLRNTSFVRFLAGFTIFQVGIGFMAAFVPAYMLKNLGLSFTEISLYTIIGNVAGIVGNRFWGPVMDAGGVKSTMLTSLVLVSLVPVAWVLALPFGAPMIIFAWILAGFAWSGHMLALINWPFALSPKASRTYFLSIQSIVTGVAFAVGSLCGGQIAEFLNEPVKVLGVTLVNYQVLLLISAFLRLSAFLFYVRVPDGRYRGMLYIAQYSTNLAYLKIMNAARLPGYAFRPGRKRRERP